jgi:hypothetical protein
MGTTFDTWSILVLCGLAALVLVELWVVIPRLHGLPKDLASRAQIRRAMQLADVQPEETLYDLRAGDGRALVIAAREFGARAVGIEIEPVHCAVAWLWSLLNGVVARVSVRRRNLLQVDLGDADVVFLYLTPALVEQLRPRLQEQLRPGTRVVSLHFDFEGWQPANIDVGHLLFLYRMPPEAGNIESFMRQGTD